MFRKIFVAALSLMLGGALFAPAITQSQVSNPGIVKSGASIANQLAMWPGTGRTLSGVTGTNFGCIYGLSTSNNANYERLCLTFSSNIFNFASQNLGSGQPREVRISTTSSAAPITFVTNNTDRFVINGGGGVSFIAAASNRPGLFPSNTTLLVRLGDNSASTDISAKTVDTDGFTVATLPTGTAGMRAYVTDQAAACVAAGAALTGGGAVVCPVFYNGTAWVGD